MKRTGKVLVVGDVMADVYLEGAVSRLSPEAPIPIVRVDQERLVPGGAGNVAMNLVALGLDVVLVGALGRDADGEALRARFADHGIEGRFAEASGTTRKVRVLSRHQHVARLDFDVILERSEDKEESLLSLLDDQVDAIVISDYGKGVCSETVCAGALALARRLGCEIYVDPKGTDWRRYGQADLVKPNLHELKIVAGRELADEPLEKVGEEVRRVLDLDRLLVTLGPRGAALIQPDGCELFPTRAMDVYDVCGAGDTALAALTAARVWGQSWGAAVDFANRAARVVVGKTGTSTTTLAEIEALEQGGKVCRLEELLVEIDRWRAQGLRIVFTNGCFDLLHAGHVSLLAEAGRLGDRLIVAVNDDAGIRRLKGASRPVNPLSQRVQVLAALQAVDRILPFSEDTPREILRAIRPHVLVKGNDYELEEVVGREFSEETVLVPIVEGLSSTALTSRLASTHRLTNTVGLTNTVAGQGSEDS